MNHLAARLPTALACLLLAVNYCPAATLFYLSADGAGSGAAPASPQETLKFLPSGGSFHIWMQPDAQFTGVSLAVEKTGSAIRFTGSTVHNPAVGNDTRWLPGLMRDGTVTDSKVSRIEGGALPTITGNGAGVGPSTSGSDALYEAGGGFLFATIDFAVANATATSEVAISIGHNLLGGSSGAATGIIHLGVGDGPVANTAGATGSTTDLKFEPKPLHPSDFNSDGEVNGIDQLTWQRGHGITSGATRTQGDANGDGKIDGADIALWEAQFGTMPTPTVALGAVVPEPASVWMAICAASAVITARGRRR